MARLPEVRQQRVRSNLAINLGAGLHKLNRLRFHSLCQRGLFVGGGGSTRIPRLIGAARMADMMLTGRVYGAEEGVAIGLAQYVVDDGQGLAQAFALAEKVAANAPLSNFAVMHALPRIAGMSREDGLFTESLMAAIAQGDDAAKDRMRDFLAGKGAKVRRS